MNLEELEALEKTKNNGRGVSCVNTALFYLRQGDKQSAFAVCMNESDKISSYPDLKLGLFDLIPAYEASLTATAKAFNWKNPRQALLEKTSQKTTNHQIEIE